jgi:hypothetical protein
MVWGQWGMGIRFEINVPHAFCAAKLRSASEITDQDG